MKKADQEPHSVEEMEGLTLLVAENLTSYFGVYLNQSCKTRPFQARVRRGGKPVSLGPRDQLEPVLLVRYLTPHGLYVLRCIIHISLFSTVHSVMAHRPTLYFTVLSVMGRRPTP